jgi:hypothetical protein
MGMQMFSAIRRRLTYTNVAMTLALVFAMSGGAYAAGKYLITSTKQISPKVLKSLAGKTGKAGAAGATGAQGPVGPAGAAGAQGQVGAVGKEGPQGKEGPAGPAGAKGENGTTGFTETLPKGKTLRGAWAIQADVTSVESPQGSASTAVSFGIPLATAPTAVYAGEASSAEGTGDLTENSFEVKNVTATSGSFTRDSMITGANIPANTRIEKVEAEAEPGHFTLTLSGEGAATATEPGAALTASLPAGCTGDAAEPGAEPGNLCIFAAGEFNNDDAGQPKVCAPEESLFGCLILNGVTPTAGREGASIVAIAESTGFLALNGTWAVTAE